MSSKHKIKRIERVLGWTKASHKGAIIYFSGDKEDKPVKSLKRKKFCKFTKGDHGFEIVKVYEPIYLDSSTYIIKACKYCGKKSYEFQKKKETLKN